MEGDSAAKSVDQVRDSQTQAVLALQGKPLNAVKASRQATISNEIFLRCFETLLGWRVPGLVGSKLKREQGERVGIGSPLAGSRHLDEHDPTQG